MPTFALVVVFAFWSGLDAEEDKERLRDRAKEIVEKNETLEMSTAEARRAVQVLLRDLEDWAEANELELVRRTRTVHRPRTDQDELLSADRCALFYQEELQMLCPLDLRHSEVWGAQALFCRYQCAP